MWHDGHQVMTLSRPSFVAASLNRSTVRVAILLAARSS
jgi:hypothetical protein